MPKTVFTILDLRVVIQGVGNAVAELEAMPPRTGELDLTPEVKALTDIRDRINAVITGPGGDTVKEARKRRRRKLKCLLEELADIADDDTDDDTETPAPPPPTTPTDNKTPGDDPDA